MEVKNIWNGLFKTRSIDSNTQNEKTEIQDKIKTNFATFVENEIEKIFFGVLNSSKRALNMFKTSKNNIIFKILLGCFKPQKTI